MKNIELFEYLELIKSSNTLNGIPLEDLKAVLTGDDSTDWALATDSIYFMVFKNKITGELVTINCVNQYYDLNQTKGRAKCYNRKKEFMDRDIPHCIPENCAKCHACCIEDFFNGKITKKQ